MCNKCKDADKRGGDILHSYRLCPLVKCNRYHQLDHISKNCTNPRGCPFRVHLVSTFSFSCVRRTPVLRYNLVPCFNLFSFRVVFVSPPEAGGVSLSVPFLPPLSFVFSCTSRFNSPFHVFAAHPCYGTNFVSVFQSIFLSGGLLSSRVHLVSTLLFRRSPHTLATVQISFPCLSLFSFRVVFETHGQPR